jgi:hypothetical protein
MKKLSLRIEDINVTAVEMVAADTRGAGTVQGAEFLTRWTFCDGQDTCWYTCANTCDPSLCG